jgi:2-polyprenyl-3-methyl-5-hydroxy-6-metoxy-1,4-benzoquinol methylase
MDFADLKNTWNHYGKTEMYWSVITDPQFKNSNFTDNGKILFFQTGHENIMIISQIAIDNGISFRNKKALDFGCGVGRLTLALSPHVKHITGIDISSGHLQEALNNKIISNQTNVDFFQSNENITIFGSFDIIISLIVLQHNRPVLMKEFINQLLSILTHNGSAFLHIPYSIENYSSKKSQYIMEMHYLPLNEIWELAHQNNCDIKQYDTDMCGANIKNAIFLFNKL